MNDSHIIQLDHLNAEHRILKARYEHRGQQMRQLIKWIFLSPLLGIALGAFGMIYFELPKAQPVVVEIERSAPGDTAGLEAQIKALNAKIEANYTQQMQRQKEVRFKTDKLELTKQVHEAKFVTAQEGADHIRQMAKALGVTSMVLK